MANWFTDTLDTIKDLGTAGVKGYTEVTKAQADKMTAQAGLTNANASATAKAYIAQNSTKIFTAIGLVVGIFAVLFLVKMFKK